MRTITFVSSTAYDLGDARARLDTFLTSIGHVAMMHENAAVFGVAPGKHSHDACLDQVDAADYLVLVVGGRRGGTYVGSERSITNEEYRRARKRGIPIMVFIKRDVDQAWRLYRRNPGGDFSDVVNDVRIFDFIDQVRGESTDNWAWLFDDVEDIVTTLRGQFAFFHHLFSKQHVESLRPTRKSAEQPSRLLPFPSDFLDDIPGIDGPEERTAFLSGLKGLRRIISKMHERRVSGIDEKIKVLWVFRRYGDHQNLGLRDVLRMTADSFKQYTWGTTKGARVFQQMSDFEIVAEYDFVDHPATAELGFSGENSSEILFALTTFVRDLVSRHGEDGIALFRAFDVSLYREG